MFQLPAVFLSLVRGGSLAVARLSAQGWCDPYDTGIVLQSKRSDIKNEGSISLTHVPFTVGGATEHV